MSSDSPHAHIIVMDDETVIRGLIAKTLRRHGYEVWEAAEGEEALRILREKLQDGAAEGDCLLILDLIVPTGLGGMATLEKAREIAPGIRAIIASGYSDDEALTELKARERTDIMTKPYDMKGLLATVKGLIEGPDT